MNWTELLSFVEQLAREAGDLIESERSGTGLTRDYKQGVELVTQADLKAEQWIIESINRRFPEHQILAEESANDLSSLNALAYSDTPLWVIDPIDGTVNYAHGHHQVGISIAVHCQGETRIGIVYNPFTDELFSAVRGQGAHLNGQPISVSGKSELGRALVATGFPYHKNTLPELIARLGRLMPEIADVRRLGAASLDLCGVACGRLDAYYEQELKPWDMAAGWLIVQEAGGQCGHLQPADERSPLDLFSHEVLVASPALFEPIKSILVSE